MGFFYLFFNALRGKNTSFLYLLFLFLGGSYCSFVDLNAQNFALHQYQVEDGLPSSFIYDITQDQSGFIWISTESGLCRFDGLRFEKNPIPEGLSTEIIEVNVDSKGRLWMIDLATNIGHYDGNKVEWLDHLQPSNNFQFTSIKEDYLGNFWYLKRGYIVAEIRKEDGSSHQIKYERKDLQLSNSMVEGLDSNLYVLSNFGVGVFENYKLTFRPFEQPFRTIPENGILYEGKILFSVANDLFFYDTQTDSLSIAFPEYQELLDTKISLLLYHDQNLWITTKTGVLLVQDVASDSPKVSKLLDGIVAGNIIVDHHNGHWLSTQGNGIFYLPNLNVEFLPTPKEKGILTSLGSNGSGNVILGYDNSRVQMLDSQFQIVYDDLLSPTKERIYEISYYPKDEHYRIASRHLYTVNSDFSEVQKSPIAYFLKAVRMGVDSNLWLGTSSSAGFMEGDSLYRNVALKRTYSVAPLPDKKAWIGSISGLYYYDGNKASLAEQEELQQGIKDIQMGSDSTLWIATPNDGV